MSEDAIRTVEAFVRRARRVESHSLLRDKVRFAKWAHGSGQVQASGDGTAYVEWDVPPEEAFESLTARCRPFLLNKEPVHYPKVLTAIRDLVESDEELGRAVDAVEENWTRATKRDGPLAFFVRTGRLGEPFGDPVNDGDAAHSWLYSDLVHADPDRDNVGIDTRFIAAVIVYGQIALSAVATLNLVLRARDLGLVEIDEAALTAPVSVRVPMRFPASAIASGPAGKVAEVEAFLDQSIAEAARQEKE